MALENILKRISEDAKKEAKAIKYEANKKAVSIRNQARQEAKAKENEILTKGKAQAAEEERRTLAMARLRSRNTLLEEKQKAVDAAFDNALERLVSLSKKEYRDLMKKLLISAVQTGDEKVIVNSSGVSMIPPVIDEVNSILAKDEKKGELTIAKEQREIRGGFILRAGNIEINNSFEALVASMRKELEPEVLKIFLSA